MLTKALSNIFVRGELVKKTFALVVICLFCLSAHSAFADGTGTSVTGFLSFNGGSTNYFDPANGFVPAGYGNVAGTTVTIGAGTEFGFDDTANLDTADFTGTTLTISDTSFGQGEAIFEMQFTDPAFTGFTVGVNGLGLTSSFSGDTLTLNFAGGDFDGTETSTYTYSTSTGVTPEPSSLALLGTGVLAAAGALRRRLIS
jgi:PEP-CTERM motif